MQAKYSPVAKYAFYTGSIYCTFYMRNIVNIIKLQLAAVMVATAGPAAEHGLFNRIRQVDSSLYSLIQSCESATPKQHVDRFSRFCTRLTVVTDTQTRTDHRHL